MGETGQSEFFAGHVLFLSPIPPLLVEPAMPWGQQYAVSNPEVLDNWRRFGFFVPTSTIHLPFFPRHLDAKEESNYSNRLLRSARARMVIVPLSSFSSLLHAAISNGVR